MPVFLRSAAVAILGWASVFLAPASCAGQEATVPPGGDAYSAWLSSVEAQSRAVTDRRGKPFQGLLTEVFVFPAAAEPGKALTVVESTRNVSSVPVYVLAGLDTDPEEILIHDMAGKPVPLTPLGRKVWAEPHGEIGNGLPVPVCIKPGFAVAAKVCAEKYYDLSRQGTYTILAGTPVKFEIVGRQVSHETDAKRDAPGITTGLLDDQPSFERKWQAASAAAGHVRNDLQLTSLIAPEEPRARNLIVSLTNVCRSGAVAHNDAHWYSDSYSPEDGVKPTVGTTAADYQILVRDASGDSVSLSVDGQARLRGSELKWDRALRPGEAIGFVFPLDEMFALKSGQQYTVIVVLRGRRRDDLPWVAAPVAVDVPPVEIPGSTRPRYGSNEFWARLATLANPRRAELTLESTISGDEYADLRMELVNRSGRRIQAHFEKGDETILIRDRRGNPVLANESSKAYAPGWSFRGEDTWGVLHPRGGDAPDDSGATGSYRLSGQYPLRAGNDYQLLCAVSLREGNALVVAAPLAFRAPIPYRHEAERPENGPSNPKALPTAPEAKGARWREYERFAGKTYEGLALQAHATQSLQLDVELRNASKEPILVKKWKGDSDFELLVRDAFGNSAPMTEKGKNFFGGGTLLEIRALKPGEAITASLPLTELFDMTAPGEYTVLASLPVIGDVDAVLTAAPVKIRVDSQPRVPKT
jgi:hypothetical protein